MKSTLIIVASIVVVLSMAGMTLAAEVPGWNAFVVRNANSGGLAPAITDDIGGGKLFQIAQDGQKAAWGTNNMNGQAIGDIQAISITRVNGTTGWGPYMNFWVTDGQGGYAVLSNEPSNTGEWTGSSAYDTTWSVLQHASTWVYEVNPTAGFKLPDGTTTHSILPAGASPFKFADFAGYTIATPANQWGGTGAPDDLNAAGYTAYGVNWVFGDSQSNYLGGYLVSNPTVVPEPMTLSLLAAGGLALLRRRKH